MNIFLIKMHQFCIYNMIIIYLYVHAFDYNELDQVKKAR